MNKLKLIVILIFFLSIGHIKSQTANVSGKIIDASTGEELIGASIMIPGTLIGAATDLSGDFLIKNVPVGTYDFKCSYISYETLIITGFEVKELGDNYINVKLNPVSYGLKQFEVKARVVRKSEVAVLTVQKKSAGVIDAVSSQQMSRLSTSDAASALSKVNGISVEGGKYVYVRGLGDRYSKTEINGAEVPSLDPERNTVQMDLFPSNIIDNIIVHKTFLPELPGSFTGGYVNINTKDFPNKFLFQFSSSVSYNTNSSFNKNFLTQDGGKTEWLSYDDGTRDIPVDAEGEIPALFMNNNKLDVITKSFNKKMEPIHEKSFMDHSHSISIGNQVDLFKKPLGYIASLSYSRDYDYYDDGTSGLYKLTGPTSTTLNKEENLKDEKGVMNVLIGGLLNLSYKFSNNHKLSLNLISNRSGQETTWFQEGEKPSDNPEMVYQKRTMQFTERSFTAGQINGEHYFENMAKVKIDWLSSYTIAKQDEPDFRLFNSDYEIFDGDTIFSIRESLYPLPTRYYRDMKENNLDNRVNFEIPFKFRELNSKFKAGGLYVYKFREFNDRRIKFGNSNNSYNGNIQEFIDDSNIGQNAQSWIDEQKYGIYAVDVTEMKNSYTASQSIIASYAMVDMKLNTRLRVIAGARYESTNIFVESLDPTKEKGELNENDILPALSATYSLNENMNLRAAITRTLARPTFRELAPYDTYNPMKNGKEIGNPNLERTLIDNLDLRWEYFMKPGEIISFSGFYKKFINPIEVTDNPIAVNPEFTWQNVDEAKVYGVEFDFRKKLDFISNSLKNFKVGTNFTYVYSAVSIDSLELVGIKASDPDYSDKRAMFGQSPYVFNADLEYSNDSIGLAANIAFNVSGPKLVLVIKGGTPDVYEQPRGQLDFNVSKTLGDKFSVKFGVKNILNTEIRKIYTYKDEEYIFKSYSYGRTFSIGFTYLID
ncbi:MAG: TonB-dependent receptor [Saprospiraceae bacterium]|nr:TonB-dependent receptor [Saprospiraceae bacterium]